MINFFFLADFSVIRPELGLIFWTSLVFIVVYFFLSRFAFKPIQEALKKREHDIQDSLNEARKARDEMASLKAENETLLIQAREERAKILREATEAKDTIIKEAKETAKEEARRMIQSAKEQIENQRMAAITDIKNEIGKMAIEVAEKVIKKDLGKKDAQESLVTELVADLELN